MSSSPSLKQVMQEISGIKAPGPSTTFTVFHFFYALELMAQKPVGRNKLAEKLEVGDGAIRTIINRLKSAGFIVTSKAGCSLTTKGYELWCRFERIFPKRSEFPKTELTLGEHNFAFLVQNVGNKVQSGIDQRDAAIIAGARKASAIVVKNDCLTIESVSGNLKKDYPKAVNFILKNFSPKNNDAIVIAEGDSMLKAKSGAFAASWSLINAEG